MFSRLVKEMAKIQGVTEQLKANNQMVWVGKMNAIRNAAIEVVNKGNYICIKLIASDRFGLRLFLKSINNISFFIKFICINKTTYKLGRTFRSTIRTYSSFFVFASWIRIARALVGIFF